MNYSQLQLLVIFCLFIWACQLKSEYDFLSTAQQNTIFNTIIEDVITRYEMDDSYSISIRYNRPEVLEASNEKSCDYISIRKEAFDLESREVLIVIDSIFPAVPKSQFLNKFYLTLSHICKMEDHYVAYLWVTRQNAGESLGVEYKFDKAGQLIEIGPVVPIVE